jgi:hypothetical protein
MILTDYRSGLQVLTAAIMNIFIVWNVTPYSLLHVQWGFGGIHCLRLKGRLPSLIHPEDGSNMVFRNVSELLPDYTASYSRRWYSSKYRLLQCETCCQYKVCCLSCHLVAGPSSVSLWHWTKQKKRFSYRSWDRQSDCLPSGKLGFGSLSGVDFVTMVSIWPSSSWVLKF